MADLVNCKTCSKEISITAPTCPHCGQEAPGLYIKCPKCDSMNISLGQKGFGLGKALGGLLLFGSVGALGGMIGRKKLEFMCRACGKKWKATPENFAPKPDLPKSVEEALLEKKRWF